MSWANGEDCLVGRASARPVRRSGGIIAAACKPLKLTSAMRSTHGLRAVLSNPANRHGTPPCAAANHGRCGKIHAIQLIAHGLQRVRRSPVANQCRARESRRRLFLQFGIPVEEIQPALVKIVRRKLPAFVQ